MAHWEFIIAQMKIIPNRLFFKIQYHSFDFFWIYFYINQWLVACVTVERAVTAIKRTRFNKQKIDQQ